MTPEQEAEATASWIFKFRNITEEIDIPPECVYNADQNGLYFPNIWNTLYVDMKHKKSYRGCKKMKDNMCTTLMLCTSEYVEKCPLAVIGKSKNPMCFSFATLPLPYKEKIMCGSTVVFQVVYSYHFLAMAQEDARRCKGRFDR